MLTEAQLAWAAGFIDGEGCFYAGLPTKGSWRTSLSVSQNDARPLLELREMFQAGSIHRQTARASQWFVAGSRQLARVIPLIRPYLRVKGEQADALLAIVFDAHENVGRAIGPEGHARRLEMVKALKATRGPVVHHVKT